MHVLAERRPLLGGAVAAVLPAGRWVRSAVQREHQAALSSSSSLLSPRAGIYLLPVAARGSHCTSPVCSLLQPSMALGCQLAILDTPGYVSGTRPVQ